MRRRVIITFSALLASFLLGMWISGRDVPAIAQQVTSTYFTAIAGPFDFLYAYPHQIGWSSAEDKRGDSYIHGYKIDVDRNRANCLHWTAVGAIPAAQFSMDEACSGGTRLGPGIYWFDAPSISTPTATPAASASVPLSPTPTGSAAPPIWTATPTKTPSPFPTSKTSTPAPGGTAIHTIPTLSPAQKSGFSIYCDRSLGSYYTMTIWGSYGLVYGVPDEWCKPSRDANEALLERLAKSTPAIIEVKP